MNSMQKRFSRVAMTILMMATATSVLAQDVYVKVSSNYTSDGGSKGEFVSIQNALDHAPEPANGRRLYIQVAPGTYHERVHVSQLRPRVTLLGMGSDPSQVVISAGQNGKSSQSTFFSETVEILGDNFEADNLTFENTAGATGQAIALSVTADRVVFKHCRILGFQDTLFANYGRQYYVNSYISGAVDFIFGDATAVFENSELHIVRSGFLTAQSRTSANQTTGYVFLHCRITTGDLGGKSFLLGRPWRSFARVIFIDTEIPASLDPKGWSDWGRDPHNTFYGERGNTGPGSETKDRVSWAHQLTEEQAHQFLPQVFLSGQDKWDAIATAARLP